MGYPGGKAGAGVYQLIVNQMPPHDVYVEAFAGGAAVLRAKRSALVNYAIERDRGQADLLSSDLALAAAGVTVICADAISALPKIVGGEPGARVLVYCDPPYLASTRRSRSRIYAREFRGESQHENLLWLLKSLPCMVMISGYWSDLYGRELAGWRAISYQTRTHVSTATEWLWCNFPEPWELHDYQYLGAGYRERERIKRKKQRWIRRLAGMPALERYALLDAIQASNTSPD